MVFLPTALTPRSVNRYKGGVEFILHYRGELRPNGNATDKHRIRQWFHPQLKKLWEEPPLNDFRNDMLAPTTNPSSIIRELGAFQFAPLVSLKVSLLAELEITLLRPGLPGSIVLHGGDIDNRLKTLFDALAVPSQSQALPQDAMPSAEESPFFCVLDDDRLITKVSIQTGRLLEDTTSASEVELMVLVRTKKVPNEINVMGFEDI